MAITIHVTSGKHTATVTLPREKATANRVAACIREAFVVPEGADVPAVTYEDDEGDSISLNLGVTVEFEEALRVMEATNSSLLRFKLAEALAPRERNAMPMPAPSAPAVKFEGDVTIPDGAHVAASKPFVKTWLVSTPSGWGPGCVLRCVDMWSSFAGLKEVVPSVPAGSQAEISITLTAPQEVGHYRSYWALAGPDGKQFGEVLFVEFHAVDNVTTTANAPSGGAEKQSSATTTAVVASVPPVVAVAAAAAAPTMAAESTDVVSQISALLQGHTADMAKRVDDLQCKVASESRRADHAERLVDSLASSQETLRTSLSAERETTAALRGEVGTLRADNVALARQRDELAAELEQQRAETKGLVDTIAEQREALCTKDLEVQDLRKEAAVLRAQLEAVYAKIAGLLPGTTATATAAATAAVQHGLQEFTGAVVAVATAAANDDVVAPATAAAPAAAAATAEEDLDAQYKHLPDIAAECHNLDAQCETLREMGFNILRRTALKLLNRHGADVALVVQELLKNVE
jgi:hypothetical protein